MQVATLGRLAIKHVRNSAAEALYLRAKVDLTRPVAIYALINEHCNARCRSCEFWRMKEYAEELGIEQWQEALVSFREFVGRYSINFSGGEPLLKPGFVDLAEFCARRGISWGVTTNGSCFTPAVAERLVAARPFNVNVSVDAPCAELHDYLRGMPGLFERLCRGLRRLIAQRDAQGAAFPIIIKPTISAKNLGHLVELVQWAQQIGAAGVNFQPLEHWSPETYDELWIGEDQLDQLEQVIERLIALKQRGAPILNPIRVLRLLPMHFRQQRAPPQAMPCRVGLRSCFISPSGHVKLCGFFPAIGNVRTHSAREIWCGPTAQQVRRETLACTRLCLATCTSQKSLCDKVHMAWQLLRGARARPHCNGAGAAGGPPDAGGEGP